MQLHMLLLAPTCVRYIDIRVYGDDLIIHDPLLGISHLILRPKSDTTPLQYLCP